MKRSDKHRALMNAIPLNGEFTNEQMAIALNADPNVINWIYAPLIKSGHLSSHKIPLQGPGSARAIYKRLKFIEQPNNYVRKQAQTEPTQLCEKISKGLEYQFIYGGHPMRMAAQNYV